jgi:hypothetical protein
VELPAAVDGRTDRCGKPLSCPEVFAEAVWDEMAHMQRGQRGVFAAEMVTREAKEQESAGA